LLKQKKIRTNKVNGKSYIGSSVNLARRFSEYFSDRSLEKKNMAIYKALLKYGYSNFSFEILKYCEPSECILYEQDYMDLYNPSYNISPTAGSRLGSQHSEAARQKMREA
jgi:group I intron endonuclease